MGRHAGDALNHSSCCIPSGRSGNFMERVGVTLVDLFLWYFTNGSSRMQPKLQSPLLIKAVQEYLGNATTI
jgi:hypothetical protein